MPPVSRLGDQTVGRAEGRPCPLGTKAFGPVPFEPTPIIRARSWVPHLRAGQGDIAWARGHIRFPNGPFPQCHTG